MYPEAHTTIHDITNTPHNTATTPTARTSTTHGHRRNGRSSYAYRHSAHNYVLTQPTPRCHTTSTCTCTIKLHDQRPTAHNSANKPTTTTNNLQHPVPTTRSTTTPTGAHTVLTNFPPLPQRLPQPSQPTTTTHHDSPPTPTTALAKWTTCRFLK